MSAPPQLFAELAEDEFDPFYDAKDVIGDTAPVSSSFTADAQDTTLTFQIPANKIRSALRYYLGYSYADGSAPYSLHRELPARHPVFPQLYAYSASVTEFGPKPNTDNPENEPYLESPFEASDGSTMYYASYNKALLTVKYKSWGRIRFLPDSDIDSYLDEYKRYCSFDSEPSMESLQADGSSQLVFREGGGANQPTPAVGTPPTLPYSAFPAPIAELMGKTALTVTWLQVPHNYLSTDPDILLLDRFLGKYSLGATPDNYATWKYPPRIGTVNKDFFLGFYPGTLLLRAVKATSILYPVTCADPYDNATGWNLQMVWEHFDPVKGIAYSVDPANPSGVPIQAGKSPYRGHRIFPYARTGQWYYATRAESGKELLPLVNHWPCFSNVNDPDAV